MPEAAEHVQGHDDHDIDALGVLEMSDIPLLAAGVPAGDEARARDGIDTLERVDGIGVPFLGAGIDTKRRSPRLCVDSWKGRYAFQ